jgi:hypothetical protein
MKPRRKASNIIHRLHRLHRLYESEMRSLMDQLGSISNL